MNIFEEGELTVIVGIEAFKLPSREENRPGELCKRSSTSSAKGILSNHVQYARTIDWAKTPPRSHGKLVAQIPKGTNLCMANPHPAALSLGSELTMLYNVADAAEVADKNYPSIMAIGFSGLFAELWDYAGPIFCRVRLDWHQRSQRQRLFTHQSLK